MRRPHPVIWTILYIPFGALSGFVSVALTFRATQHGLSITEGALLTGAQLLTQWLKWLWAPAIDITLTPKRWYAIATLASGVGVFAMSALPMSPKTLVLLLAIIAAASLVNSVVGMSIESLIASSTPAEEIGRVSAWFQAGNLGGAGLGGALGLFLMQQLPRATWWAGLVMASLFAACCLALRAIDDNPPHAGHGVLVGVRSVVRDLFVMLKTRGGLLSAVLCALPIGTGAAAGVLTQAKVAAYWGAGDREVALMQGLVAGLVTAIGCFAGGWICKRFHPRSAYAGIGIALAIIAAGMAITPPSVAAYVVWNFAYSFAVGLAYASFTAVVLVSMGQGAAATKYTVFASLSNFPIWWLGLLLGRVADIKGPVAMLLTEAAAGIVGVALFAVAVMLVRRSKLPA